MTVDSRKVRDRRQLRFESLGEVLAEAERLTTAEKVHCLGNWSLGQILWHLAEAIHASIDGLRFEALWYEKIVGRLIRPIILWRGFPPGYQLKGETAETLAPKVETTVEEGLSALRKAVDRIEREPARQVHGVFGRLSPQQWLELHLRHAELHLSFVLPKKM